MISLPANNEISDLCYNHVNGPYMGYEGGSPRSLGGFNVIGEMD